MEIDVKVKKAQEYMIVWAERSVRPTRNGEQIRKYINRANNTDEIIAGYAYVLKYKGFPHERSFHKFNEKVSKDDIKAAHTKLEMRG